MTEWRLVKPWIDIGRVLDSSQRGLEQMLVRHRIYVGEDLDGGRSRFEQMSQESWMVAEQDQVSCQGGFGKRSVKHQMDAKEAFDRGRLGLGQKLGESQMVAIGDSVRHRRGLEQRLIRHQINAEETWIEASEALKNVGGFLESGQRGLVKHRQASNGCERRLRWSTEECQRRNVRHQIQRDYMNL